MNLHCDMKQVGKSFHAVVSARDEATGVLRFQVSFRRKIGNDRLLESFNRQEFSESGVLVACNKEATIVDIIFHRMRRMAYARLFKSPNQG